MENERFLLLIFLNKEEVQVILNGNKYIRLELSDKIGGGKNTGTHYLGI